MYPDERGGPACELVIEWVSSVVAFTVVFLSLLATPLVWAVFHIENLLCGRK